MLWGSSACGVVASLVLCALMVAGEDFNPSRTLLIEQTPALSHGFSNFLFRGNEPIINKTFCIDELVASLHAAATKANKTLPAQFFLIDYSLLNVLELPDELVEKKWFEAHPIRGEYTNHVIVGSLMSPPEHDKDLLEKMAKNLGKWNFDDLPKKIPDIHALVYSPRNVTVVVYVHCEAGTDRTGEVSGSYYMTYQNMTFQQALYVDNHVQHRDIEPASRNGMQWYCYYLHYARAFPLDCTLPSP